MEDVIAEREDEAGKQYLKKKKSIYMQNEKRQRTKIRNKK